MFNTKNKGFGFGPMPGFKKKGKGTISGGNWDRDPKPNRTDCEPFNFKKQDKQSLTSWIKENREEIDSAIRNVVPEARIDDAERRMWVLNDEGLYNWAKSERVNV